MADFRSQKTDDLIVTAFVDLVLEKGFDHVTVTSIADRALINRKTFYEHYPDKFALTDAIRHAIIMWFEMTLQKRATLIRQGMGLSETIGQLEPELRQLLTSWRQPLNALLSIHEVKPQLLDDIQQVLSAQLKWGARQPVSELTINVLNGIMMGMLKYDLETNQLPSRQELQELTQNIRLILGDT
ncbi:MAG TPA: TetR/AcrR family transcriptional regulator [Candidatus Levilactobacillus faecigallinarum]|uniref:TetR/AcrR family transcriptional regulator n=1 Tax=Candidatus Levilactobacillus faecigallinarum TaxID=2838638 RepID=A0A9D1U541_9LACO|nr:TetR/AcrR family transcriptional regulator [Candidatus Levilactobacillus faecigallinarum]